MGRYHQLLEESDRIFRHLRAGSPAQRAQRCYLMKLIIRDLKTLPQLPSSLTQLTRSDIEILVAHWKEQQWSHSTIINRLAVLRFLAQNLSFKEPIPSNVALGLRKQTAYKIAENIDLFHCYQQFHYPASKVIFGMSLFFGLTFDEAINLQPLFHIDLDSITIPRSLAFNSLERSIPFCHPEQTVLTDLVVQLLPPKESLKTRWTRPILMGLYRGELAMQGLRYAQYRHHYARFRTEQLKEKCSRQECLKLIKKEMGLLGNVQLWRYLKSNIVTSHLSALASNHNQQKQV
ncbi:MAG: putative integrase [Gammaproteobacteria bacterium]|jgi:hypothetical protein|nr:putative integrase [Gammaproteobacteria bacterium]